MTTAKSLLRIASEGFAITVVGDALNKMLGIVATFIILAWLTPYEYGLWRLLQSVLTACSILTLTGLTGVVVADIVRELGRKNTVRAHTILWRSAGIFVGASCVAALVLCISAPLISSISKIDLTNSLFILAIPLLLGGFFTTLQIFFQAYLKPIHALIVKNVGNVAYLIGIGVFIASKNLGVLGLSIAFALSVVVPVLMYSPYLISLLTRAKKDSDKVPYVLSESVNRKNTYALFGDYATIAQNALWPWLLGYFVSIETVGYVGLALVITAQIYSLLPIQYVLRSILPRFADDHARLTEWLQRGMKYSLWLHAVSALVLMAIASILLPALFPAYAHALPYAYLLLLAVPFRAIAGILTEWFYVSDKQKELFIATAVPKLGSLVALPFLLLWLDVYGFILWYVIVSDAVLLIRLAYIKKYVQISMSPKELIVIDRKDREQFTRLYRQVTTRLGLLRKKS